MNDFTNDLNNMSHDEIHKKFIEYSRMYQRIQRNGDPDIVKKAGRKPVSPEHKRATYERTLARKKEKRMEKAKEEGRLYGMGRPVKLPIPNTPTSITV